MPMRLKYPEAGRKAAHYDSLAQSLTSNATDIQDRLRIARRVDSSLAKPQNVDGEYYDYYIKKLDDWLDIHWQQILIFDSFLDDLDTCIYNARKLKTLWSNRIGIMEEY